LKYLVPEIHLENQPSRNFHRCGNVVETPSPCERGT
jgi:hypothetical protein